ncbi:MAG: acyl-CoA thioesterase [Deltaproteobacteria bacterium]|nr:acyl-CoA thioesterase [Deltaproteobacteria bacterium]
MEWKKSPSEQDTTSTTRVRVLYADTDRMGVVYHGTYFRWFEASRASFMRRRGKPYVAIEQGGLYFPIIEAHAEYLKPARYDEVLDVEAWIPWFRRAQLAFAYCITRGDDVLVRGYTRHAAVDRKGKPTRLPQNIVKALSRSEIDMAEETRIRKAVDHAGVRFPLEI